MVRRFFRRFFRFIRRHWKSLIILVIAIIAIVLLSRLSNSSNNNSGNDSNSIIDNIFGNSNTTTVTNATSGIITFDGKKVNLFEDSNDAITNKISDVKAEVKTIEVNSNDNVNISVDGFNPSILNEVSDKKFELNLSNIENQSIVIVKVFVGGDNSFVGKIFSDDITTYYFAISVKNDSLSPSTTTNSSTPTGKIYFGDESFKTYYSDVEAQSSVANSPIYISSYLANNLIVKAEASEGTARMVVKACMIDNEVIDRGGVTLSSDNNWTKQLDISEFFGHQITLMIKAEDSLAFNYSYQYVSFFVPGKPNEETEAISEIENEPSETEASIDEEETVIEDEVSCGEEITVNEEDIIIDAVKV